VRSANLPRFSLSCSLSLSFSVRRASSFFRIADNFTVPVFDALFSQGRAQKFRRTTRRIFPNARAFLFPFSARRCAFFAARLIAAEFSGAFFGRRKRNGITGITAQMPKL